MGVLPLTPLTTDTAPGEGLSSFRAIGVGQVENGQGQKHMAARCVGGLLGKAADEPALLEFAKECVLDQAA